MIKSLSQLATSDAVASFGWGAEYLYQEELYGLEGRPPGEAELVPGTCLLHCDLYVLAVSCMRILSFCVQLCFCILIQTRVKCKVLLHF